MPSPLDHFLYVFGGLATPETKLFALGIVCCACGPSIEPLVDLVALVTAVKLSYEALRGHRQLRHLLATWAAFVIGLVWEVAVKTKSIEAFEYCYVIKASVILWLYATFPPTQEQQLPAVLPLHIQQAVVPVLPVAVGPRDTHRRLIFCIWSRICTMAASVGRCAVGYAQDWMNRFGR